MSLNDPHPIDVHVGSRLRLKRIMLGLSQQDLGETVGVTFQQVQKYEKGQNRIGSSRLYEFATILKTTVGYFFHDLDGQPSSESYGFNESDDSYEASTQNDADSLAANDKDVLLLIRYYKSVEDAQLRRKILSLVRGVARIYDERDLKKDTVEESVS